MLWLSCLVAPVPFPRFAVQPKRSGVLPCGRSSNQRISNGAGLISLLIGRLGAFWAQALPGNFAGAGLRRSGWQNLRGFKVVNRLATYLQNPGLAGCSRGPHRAAPLVTSFQQMRRENRWCTCATGAWWLLQQSREKLQRLKLSGGSWEAPCICAPIWISANRRG